jgi:diguanylate cyclase (GGDEF)-like protein/PAS domain S-box-containing protein
MSAPLNITSSDDSKRLMVVIDATGVGIWDWQIQSGVLTFNRCWAEIIGYSVDELQPIQFDTWAKNLHPDDFILAKDLLEKHWRGELELYEIEVRMKHKKGHYIWVLASGKTVEWLDDGQPKRMLGTHLDITLRKESEQKLLVASQLLHESQKIAQVGGWELDLKTNVLYWTDETYRIHDTSPEEFNLTVDAGVRYFLLDSRDRISRALEEAINQGVGYDLELVTYTTKGRKINVRTTCRVTQKNGKTVKLTGIFQDITESKRVEGALQQSYDLFQQAEAMGNMGHWTWDLTEEKLIYCSEQFAQIFGKTVPEILGYSFSTEVVIDLVHPDDKESYRQALVDNHEKAKGFDVEYRIITSSGDTRHIHERSELVLDKDGAPSQSFGTVVDITERKQAEEMLYASEQRFSSLVHSQSDLICRLSPDGILTFVNDSFISFMSNGKSELLGRSIYQGIPLKECESVKAALSQLSVEKPKQTHEISLVNTAGENRIFEWINHGLFDSNQVLVEVQSVGRDVTKIKESQNEVLRAHEKLKRIAHYDLLTDLPNRVLLADRLSRAMVQCQRPNQSLAVAYLDLDGFKIVNDTYGHDVGDKLLATLSQRMKEALCEGDTLARIGGDEFIAVMVDLENIRDGEPVLKRLLKAANGPVTVGDALLQVSASIGVTIYPQDGVDADQLIRHADQAMYVAKHAGKNRYHLFDTVQDNEIAIQREGISDICSALERREFVLHYQPKVNMHTGEVIGLEALIRWQHPERGLVPPLAFLPTIEGHDLSLDLGEWVIDSALMQISQWQSKGVNLPISVNISAYQLQQFEFTSRLAALLAAHTEVNPNSLELEILETSALSDISQVSDTMSACHDLGVRFALDDFGTGYSSLTYLRRLPVDMIKIDQSFVRDMLEDADDLAIIEGVIGLAKAFHREVIAEGVETIEHGVALLKLGCELAQGYGIAKPMSASDIPEWLSSWKADDSWKARKSY